ncbi:MAG: aminotransferase class V-fold PLP-dependent enzyme [Bacteroidota bacterium]
MTTRRDFLRRTGLASAGLAATPAWAPHASARTTMPIASSTRGGPNDEDYWRQIAALYWVTDRTTNMEAGYFGMMAAPVLAAYHRHTDRVNRESSLFARRDFPELVQSVRARVAEALGIQPGEIAFSRNATEALQALILQYNRLRAGDTVMYADLDYPAMQWAMDGLAQRHGADVATLTIPEPASHAAILDAYTEALDANPQTRLLLLTHANNKTGLIHPVRAITELAKARGADVIVDAAHSFGQVPLDLKDLGADYIGLNLHKWVGAPVGVGAMVIRERGLDGIDPAPGERGNLGRIDSRLHTGTMNFAALLTVPDALDFQDAIGVERKAARVRYLRDLWVAEARPLDGVDILTPDDGELVGAITSFRLHERGGRDENRALANTLQDEFGIFTVARSGIAGGDCVRVTPTLYNSPADTEKLVDALRVLAAR